MAHELAHNLVSDHSSQHSYYTEALVIHYFGKIAAKISGTSGMRAAGRPPADARQPRNHANGLLDED